MNGRFVLLSSSLSVGLFFGMLLFLELGRRFGLRQVRTRGERARAGVGVIDSAVYALLALLLGFTFSGATTRFDHRRELIMHEVNAMGTAWQRLEILPAHAQPEIRAAFRRYMDQLIAFYRTQYGSAEERRALAAIEQAENDLWTRAVAACLAPGGEPARMLVLPEMNEMFDMVQMERMARWIHPPRVIWLLLFLSALASALFAGYNMATSSTRNWFYIVGFAALISVVIYVTIEIEFPRIGLVRVDGMDRALVELRAKMK
jgi:hypothetical protein